MEELVLSVRRVMHALSLAGRAMRASPFRASRELIWLGLPLRVVDPWLALAGAGSSLVVFSWETGPIISIDRGGKACIHQLFGEFALLFGAFLSFPFSNFGKWPRMCPGRLAVEGKGGIFMALSYRLIGRLSG